MGRQNQTTAANMVVDGMQENRQSPAWSWQRESKQFAPCIDDPTYLGSDEQPGPFHRRAQTKREDGPSHTEGIATCYVLLTKACMQ